MRFLCAILPALLGSLLAYGEQPPVPPVYRSGDQKIVWVSGPASPGQAVVVTGAFTSGPKQVSIASLVAPARNWKDAADLGTTVQAESVSSESLSFTLPGSLAPGPFAIRISDPSGTRLYTRLNTPDVFWTMGIPAARFLLAPDAAITNEQAALGGTLRIFGRNFGSHPEVLAIGPDRSTTVLAVGNHNEWAISVSVPASLSPGTYMLRVRSLAGNDSSSGEDRKVQFYAFQPAALRSVTASSCGAQPDGKTDNAPALQRCMDNAAPAFLELSGGDYLISKPLTIPPGIYLRGSVDGSTRLLGAGRAGRSAWLDAQGRFGVQRVTIVASDGGQILSALPASGPPLGHILLDHVTLQSVASPRISNGLLLEKHQQEMLSSAYADGHADALRVGGPDIRILNTTVLSSGRSIFMNSAAGAYLSGNEFRNGPLGWYNFSDTDGLIFENSRISGTDASATGGSYSALRSSQNIYTFNNTYQHISGNDAEALTTDGPGGAYFGTVESVQGSHLVLAGAPNWKNRDWRNASVTVLGGAGAGQYRLIRAFSGSAVELERPFAIPIDNSSLITITPTQRHYLIIGNTATDVGVGVQFYGVIFESILSGNTLSRAGGISLHAARYIDGVQPNLFIQVLDNKLLRRGNFRGGPENPQHDDPDFIQVRCLPPSLSLGIVVRGNQLSDGAFIRVKNRADTIHGLVLDQNRSDSPQSQPALDQPSAEVVFHAAR